MSQHDLQPLSFSEQVSVDNYRAAMGGALAAADSLADKIVAAAVSVATAYGAVVALVETKDSATPWQAALPFVPFAAAVGLSLWAQSIAISITPDDRVDVVRGRIEGTIKDKRLWGRLALTALVIGILFAGYVVYHYYGPHAKSETTPTQVELYLSPAGSQVVARICGKRNVTVLSGEVEDVDQLKSTHISVKLTRGECPRGAGILVLPRGAVAAAKR